MVALLLLAASISIVVSLFVGQAIARGRGAKVAQEAKGDEGTVPVDRVISRRA
jgi:hypothetical protein